MRVSRTQADVNHQTVINTASELFREHGFDGIGLKDLMKGAGLTQGGFYKQFASKEDLIVQASGRAMKRAEERWAETAEKFPEVPLEAVVRFYLSRGHVEERAKGCPIVALGSDAARQGPVVKAAFEEGVKAHLQRLAEMIGTEAQDAPSEKAMVILSLMVGAVTLSRSINDTALTQGLLKATARQIHQVAAD